eukprot:scaffold76036_cov56-Phaeocystis_antarctica.AAC.3
MHGRARGELCAWREPQLLVKRRLLLLLTARAAAAARTSAAAAAEPLSAAVWAGRPVARRGVARGLRCETRRRRVEPR